MKNVRIVTSILSFFFIMAFQHFAYGQVSPYVIEVKIPPASEQSPLSLSVELTQNTQIQRVLLHYRRFGESEYKELEMLLSGRTAVATIPGNLVAPPYIEYYVEMRLADGKTTATFPSENPDANPLKIEVTGINPKDLEVRFLSPEPGETLAAEDLAIAVSLMFVSEKVDKRRTLVYLDGANVSNEVLLSDDVILYSPKNFNKPLGLGTHTLKVELHDASGQLYYAKECSFNLSTEIAIEEVKSSLQYVGNGQLEFRNEKIDTTTTVYERADARINGAYKFLSFGGDLHITNEDQPDRQPQNRFTGTLQAADYLKLQVGDAYPMFPSLFVSGKRVRGITGSLTLGFFNLDVSYGKTDRAIEGKLGGLIPYGDSSSASSRPKETIFERFGNQNPTYTTPMDTLFYRLYTSGTFARDFIAVRPSFGSGENFQLGFTYLKVKDDLPSITYGTSPQEDFVAGTDLLLAFDNQRFKWTTQVALSLSNIDISEGNLSDVAIDSVKGVFDTTKSQADHQKAVKDANDLKDLAKLGRNFITINENLTPLDPVTGFPSLALESEVTLNYFNNFVRAAVFRRGKAYMSLGNEFVQTDIAGLNVSDRIRLLENRVMTSVSYETKWNNLQNDPSIQKTTFNTLNTSVTVFPGVKLPTFTLGYGFNTRKNPIELRSDTLITVSGDTTFPSTRIDSTSIANEITNRFFFATNYDFNMLVRNNFAASVSVANKKDNTFNMRNQDNMNVSVSLSTFYKIPLQTTVSLIVSQNKTYQAVKDTLGRYQTVETPFSYSTLSLNARYRMLHDRLNLVAALAPSFGDFKRTLIQAGADYQVIENHYIVGQLDFIKNYNKPNDIIASIIYRLSF